MLETVRVRLRDLIKLIEPGERKIVYTDFEDEIGGATDAPIGDPAVGIDAARFKRKVRHFLDAHRDHIAFQKVRRAEQLTPSDVAELERMFLDEGVGDETRLDAIRGRRRAWPLPSVAPRPRPPGCQGRVQRGPRSRQHDSQPDPVHRHDREPPHREAGRSTPASCTKARSPT